jgi:hypothetical protein
MATPSKRTNFPESEEGQAVKQLLIHMDDDGAFNTEASYSADTASYSDNIIPFVDKHMRYLQSHPSVDSGQYVANLRLMTRKR